MARHRWIIIGSVRRISYRMVMSSGYVCDGFQMCWRGARDWCQPWEFDDWAQLQWAVERRLSFVGLELVDIVADVPHHDIRVLVKRNGRKLRCRAYAPLRRDHKDAQRSSDATAARDALRVTASADI